MTPDQFVYWLQGYLELEDAKNCHITSDGPHTSLNPDQVKVIQDHIRLVLTKATPEPASWPLPGTGEPFPNYPGVTYCASKNTSDDFIPGLSSKRLC